MIFRALLFFMLAAPASAIERVNPVSAVSGSEITPSTVTADCFQLADGSFAAGCGNGVHATSGNAHLHASSSGGATLNYDGSSVTVTAGAIQAIVGNAEQGRFNSTGLIVGDGIYKSTIAAVPSPSVYALALSSGLSISQGPIKFPDNTVLFSTAGLGGTVDQTATYGWTGPHTFNERMISSAAAGVDFYAQGTSANDRNFRLSVSNGKELVLRYSASATGVGTSTAIYVNDSGQVGFNAATPGTSNGIYVNGLVYASPGQFANRSSDYTAAGHASEFIQAAGSDRRNISIGSYGTASANAGGIRFFRTRGGAGMDSSVLSNGDEIGVLQFRGARASGYDEAARISVNVDGTAGSGDMPGSISFLTTPDGSATAVERLKISNAGVHTISAVDPVVISTWAATYGSGSAHVCVNNSGVLFVSEAACP